MRCVKVLLELGQTRMARPEWPDQNVNSDGLEDLFIAQMCFAPLL